MFITRNNASEIAWTTVSTRPPNFIPFKPAQALGVTDWSTYWWSIQKLEDTQKVRSKGSFTQIRKAEENLTFKISHRYIHQSSKWSW